jgi:poly-gamma-glutamate synthesis protein (capsule biosynthesis protein)
MPLNIYAVGDIMLGEQGLCYNFGVKSVIKNKGVGYLFTDVKGILKTGDIVFGNLEAPISNETNKRGFETNFFRAAPNVIESLKNANFNVLSVANNHIMEHGGKAFLSTVNSLKENNITPVGVANKTEILEVKGFKVAFMAYSFIDDFIHNSAYNKVKSERKILEDIKKIRDSVDLIIMSLHWGYEYIPFPSPEQVEIGRRLIDCGVDIVLGGIPMSSKAMRFIYFFAKWIEGHSIEVYQPLAVFTTAEKLYANMREKIGEVFNCDVSDAYGLNDGGGGGLVLTNALNIVDCI